MLRRYTAALLYGDAVHGGREDDGASQERVMNAVDVVALAAAADVVHSFVIGGTGGRGRARHGGAKEDGGDPDGGAGAPARRRECAAGVAWVLTT